MYFWLQTTVPLTHVQMEETAQTTLFHTLVNVDMVTKETTVRRT